MYAVDRAVAFAQLPYTYFVEEFCGETVMVALTEGVPYGRLRFDAFKDGAAVYCSVFWVGKKRVEVERRSNAYVPAATALKVARQERIHSLWK